MLVQKPAAIELCRELGIHERLVSTLLPRTASVLRDGRLHPIPEGSFLGFPVTARALATSSLFSLRGKARMAYELVVPRRLGDDDESVASFVGRRFGREAVDYLAEPLLAGIHAGRRGPPLRSRALPAPGGGRADRGKRASQRPEAARGPVAWRGVRLLSRRHPVTCRRARHRHRPGARADCDAGCPGSRPPARS
jgi:oxygen-dependent protoporphyrinogen oxidase